MIDGGSGNPILIIEIEDNDAWEVTRVDELFEIWFT